MTTEYFYLEDFIRSEVEPPLGGNGDTYDLAGIANEIALWDSNKHVWRADPSITHDAFWEIASRHERN